VPWILKAFHMTLNIISSKGSLQGVFPTVRPGVDLWHLMDCSPPGSSVHGIFQARILEWVAMPSSGVKPSSPVLQVDSLLSEPPGKPFMEPLTQELKRPRRHWVSRARGCRKWTPAAAKC